MAIDGVIGFGAEDCRLLIDPTGVPVNQVLQVRRTYERSRLVELAAIAMVGLGLHHAGGHEIRDVSIRGTAADYLVDHAGHHLEIAGRSRRSDFESAWKQKWQRLTERWRGGFYLLVAEFERCTARLAFAPENRKVEHVDNALSGE